MEENPTNFDGLFTHHRIDSFSRINFFLKFLRMKISSDHCLTLSDINLTILISNIIVKKHIVFRKHSVQCINENSVNVEKSYKNKERFSEYENFRLERQSHTNLFETRISSQECLLIFYIISTDFFLCLHHRYEQYTR